MAAAGVNQTFRQTLLTNPAQALRGYRNEKFDFTPSERTQILSIRAATLQEFAYEVVMLTYGTEGS